MKLGHLAALFLSSWTLDASASPWIQEEGSVYARVAWADEEIEQVGAQRADIYAEIGASDDWTATLKLEHVDYAPNDNFDSSAWRATLRRQVFRRAGFVGSIEAGVLEGAAIGGRRGCDLLGVEGRVGLGWSGELRGTDTFTFFEAATRQHEACYRTRWEFGISQRATERIWLVTQFWSERGDQDAISDKSQTDLVWRGDEFDFTVSYREELSGAFEETGVVLSLAARY